MFGSGALSESTARRGVPTLRPHGLNNELDDVPGWKAVFQLLDAVRADATLVKDA